MGYALMWRWFVWVGGWFVEVCWMVAFVLHQYCNMHGVHVHSALMGIFLRLLKLTIRR